MDRTFIVVILLVATVPVHAHVQTPSHAIRLGARYRQNGHDVDGFPGKDRKVRMPLEQLGRSLMRIRANDHIGAHLIACIFDAALGDFLVLPSGPPIPTIAA